MNMGARGPTCIKPCVGPNSNTGALIWRGGGGGGGGSLIGIDITHRLHVSILVWEVGQPSVLTPMQESLQDQNG